jgi:hypothetical protein
MAADTDVFVLSTYAAWAGDDNTFERLILELRPELHTSAMEERAEGATDIMRAVGAARLLRLRERRNEDDGGIREKVRRPFVLQTEHIRGVVWRMAEREFVLQAYLTDFAWQDELFRRAQEQLHVVPGHVEADKDHPQKIFRRLGSAWVLPGNPFVQVSVSDIGLIEAVAIWTDAVVDDRAGEAVLLSLRSVLLALDPPRLAESELGS